MFVTDANGDVYDPLRLTNEIVYGQKLCSRYCSGDTAARKVSRLTKAVNNIA